MGKKKKKKNRMTFRGKKPLRDFKLNGLVEIYPSTKSDLIATSFWTLDTRYHDMSLAFQSNPPRNRFEKKLEPVDLSFVLPRTKGYFIIPPGWPTSRSTNLRSRLVLEITWLITPNHLFDLRVPAALGYFSFPSSLSIKPNMANGDQVRSTGCF